MKLLLFLSFFHLDCDVIIACVTACVSVACLLTTSMSNLLSSHGLLNFLTLFVLKYRSKVNTNNFVVLNISLKK